MLILLSTKMFNGVVLLFLAGALACVPRQLTITDEAGLKALADCPCCAVELGSDVTLSENWEPIALFTGTLNGRGKTITVSSLTFGDGYGGVFKHLNQSKIVNLKIRANTEVKGSFTYFGLLAATAVDPYFNQVAVEGTLSIISSLSVPPAESISIGGALGYLTGVEPISDILVKLQMTVITTGSDTVRLNVGMGVGLVEHATLSAIHATGSLEVTGPARFTVGGIVGNSTSAVQYSESYPAELIVTRTGIAATTGFSYDLDLVVGGIAGICSAIQHSRATIPNMKITGISTVGGAAGYLARGTSISSSSWANVTIQVTATGDITAGGFVGWLLSSIRNCTSVGNVSLHTQDQPLPPTVSVGPETAGGGFAGRVSADVDECYAYPDSVICISDNCVSYCGGFIGIFHRQNSSIVVKNSAAVTKLVNATGGLYGIAAGFLSRTENEHVHSGAIYLCAAHGNVIYSSESGENKTTSWKSSISAGFVGYAEYLQISNTYAVTNKIISNGYAFSTAAGYGGSLRYRSTIQDSFAVVSTALEVKASFLRTLYPGYDETQAPDDTLTGGASFVAEVYRNSFIDRCYGRAESINITVNAVNSIEGNRLALLGGLSMLTMTGKLSDSFADVKAMKMKINSTKVQPHVGTIGGLVSSLGAIDDCWTRVDETTVEYSGSASPELDGGIGGIVGSLRLGSTVSNSIAYQTKPININGFTPKNLGSVIGYLHDGIVRRIIVNVSFTGSMSQGQPKAFGGLNVSNINGAMAGQVYYLDAASTGNCGDPTTNADFNSKFGNQMHCVGTSAMQESATYDGINFADDSIFGHDATGYPYLRNLPTLSNPSKEGFADNLRKPSALGVTKERQWNYDKVWTSGDETFNYCPHLKSFKDLRGGQVYVTPGQFSCSPGYSGAFCSTFQCTINGDCGPGGKCNVTPGSCQCGLGLYGSSCSESFCGSNCNKKGACTQLDNYVFTCACDQTSYKHAETCRIGCTNLRNGICIGPGDAICDIPYVSTGTGMCVSPDNLFVSTKKLYLMHTMISSIAIALAIISVVLFAGIVTLIVLLVRNKRIGPTGNYIKMQPQDSIPLEAYASRSVL
ncbi:Hypothetical protein GLP15_2057 [Giardia lamblia P15]|uniref:EGF-like domain-containing protein n=1 Tax=Giardia intestinalis (strain P15) TaxID=658858 RepID=E1F010_GIAIA|nr:Hypothetical protein GLP15_2057 [Giardia lamblia P15]